MYISGEEIINGNSYCINIFRQSFDSVYNNILINKRSNGTGTGKHYGLYIDSAKILNNFVSNNNNIYIRGNGGILAYDGTANRNTISDWVTATGKDLSSYSVNTQFIPSTSFLIDSTILSSKYLYQKGRPFEIVPADYRGVPRSTSPLTGPTCVGPYEFEFTQSPNWFEGTIYVGSGEEIKTLTDTNGLFSKINNGIITGNLTVNITSDLSETGTHALNETNEELNYRIRIIPDKNVVRNITGTCNTGGLIRLKGADRITLDGRYNGTGNYLSIKNNSNSYNTAAIQIISGGSGAKFDTIRNCIFSNANYQYRTAGIHIGDSLVSDTEGGISNNNITLIDNTITNSYYGILAIGDSIHKMDSLIIQGNTIGSSDNYIGYSGIMLRCAYSPLVSRNHIFRVSNYEGAAYGIFIGNYVSEIEISRNLIHEIKRSGTTGNTTCGIRIAAENGTTGCKMYNNLIYDIRTSGNNINFDNPFGIRIDGGINHKIYYNSINMYGAFRGSSSNPEQRFSSAILISTGSVSGMDIRNNIFKNKMTYDNVYWPYDWPYVYAIYAVSGTTFSTIDYNDYYSSSSGAFYNLGFLGTDIYTLTDWKTVTGQDIHSISSDPLFKSDSYLIPYPSSPVLRSGAPLLEVTTDYTGSERNILNPSIGGYEAAYDNDGPVITYTLLNNTTSTFNRQLNDVYISDSSHVDTLPDTRPRLYFKRNTDSNTFFNNTSLTGGWKYVVADSNTGSPFSFTINYALLSGDTGVHIGTRIQYFVIAQDKHKPVNFTVNWGMLNLTASGVNLTQSDFPVTGNINSYKIIDAAMSGDYHISLNLFNQISRKNISFEKKKRKVLKYIPVNTDENLDIEKNSSRSDIISKEEIKYEDSPDLLNQNVLNVASSELAKGKKIKYEWREIQEEYSVPVEKDDLYKGDLFFEYEYEKSSSRTKPGKDIGRGVYATITAALADLKDRGVSGAVNLILDDTLYSASETFPLVIDTVIGSSSVNKITIKPNNGVSSVISGAIGNDAIIKFYNTNYVTIDGSNNGTNSRNLTIKNTYTYNPVVVWFGSKGTGTIKYNTLKNTNIINGGPGTASAIVVGDGDNLFYSGFFSNITIRNNDISNAWNGTFVYAYSSTSVSTGYYTTVDSNTFNTPTDYYIMRCGIYTYGINYSNINYNTIKKILYPDYSYQPSGIFIDSKCYSIQIKGNIIDSVSAGIGAYGMLIRTGYYSNYIEIINNVIYSISSPGYSDWLDIPAGLMFVGNQAGIFILNNSINLFGNYLNQSGAVSVGIALRDNSYAYILNNSIVNTLGLQGVSGYGAVGIYVQSGNWQLPRIENNNYYINASSGTNTIGRIGSNFYSTLSAFRSASGGDFNSYAGNPGYLSNKNLLPDTTNLNCWNLYGKGMPLSAVAQDIRGLPRSTTIEGGPTCIGVYEFTAITNPPVATASGSPEAGDTTFYYQSERKLLEIFWGSGKDQIESSRLNNFSVKKSNDGSDDLPTNVNVQYFSGITPPDTSNIPVAKTGKVYWYIDADCDPVQPVDIKIFWGEQEIGNITDTSKLILAMYDMKTRVWLPFERGTSGNGYSIVNHTEKSITVNGIQRVDSVRFALTDKDFPLVSYRDTIAPVITYTPLGDTISKNSRILTATIYDSTGLPVSGSFQPRIYFRKNYNGSWVSTQGSKQVEKYSNVRLPEQELKYLKSESNIRKSDSDLNNTKNVTINTWNFTIDTSLIGQVNVGDSVFYYVIAQDIVTPSNIGSNPAGVVANDVNTIITHPATPSSFCIKDAFIIFEENFEESWTTPSTLNPAWSCPQTGDNEWHMSSYTTGWLSTNGGYIPKGADSTSQSARFHSYDGTGGTTGDLITPLIDFSPYPGIKKLQFYYINTTGNDFLNIYLSIDGGINYDTSLICLKIARLWTLFTIDLSTLNSQSVKIKFTATRVTSGSSDIGIDQIAVHNTDGPLSGIKTINPGGGGDNNYTSFTAAIDDLNLKGVGTGGVTFNVKDGSIYIENCPAIRSSGTLESQIIFQRDNTGNRPLIKPYNAGTQKSAGILIKGGDYITFDGIDVISNWGEIGAGFMITNATETDGAHYNTIKNSVIGDTGIYKITIGILQSSSIYEGGGVTPSSAEGTNSNNKYYNISVQKAGYGIWLHGDLVYKDSNCEIGSTTDSLITTIGAPVLGAISSNDYLLDVYGIYLIYQKDFKVFNTEVRNCRGYRNNDEVSGIKAVFCSGTSSIYNCKIHDIKTMSPYYQDPVYGICTNAYDSTAVINIHNNSVYAINHYDIQFPSQDMCVFGIYTSDIDAIVYNNSVRIDEDYKITSTAYRYNGLGSGYSLSIMNNVFANYSSGNSNSRRYCLDLNCGPPKQLNNNTYYIITGTNNYIGCINVQNCSTLSHWRTASGKENNSNFGEPGFLSVSNLLPDSTSYNCWYLYGKGMPIAEIETDIRGLSRSTIIATGPTCIGAYEFTTNTSPPVATASGSPVAGDTTFYTQSERDILSILWGTGGADKRYNGNSNENQKQIQNNNKSPKAGGFSWMKPEGISALPNTVSVQKFSGQKASEIDTAGWTNTAKRGSGYWKVAVDQQPTSTFAVTLYFGDEELGNISDPANNLILAKYDPNTHTWTPFPRTTDAGANWASYVDWPNRTVTVKGLTDFGGASLYSEFALTDQTAPLRRMRLDLTALIAGFYNDVSNTMVSDLITLELRTETSPYTLIDQSVISAGTTGGAVFYSYSAYTDRFTGSSIKYWIVFKHRNSLETWSVAGNAFNNVTGTMSYDFTTAITQAYGSNLIQKGTKYCIINGDADQDGSVGALDRSACWNNRNLSGYYSTDLDGDGSVGALDRSICWNYRNRTVQKPSLLDNNSKGNEIEKHNTKNGKEVLKGYDIKLDGSSTKKKTNNY